MFEMLKFFLLLYILFIMCKNLGTNRSKGYRKTLTDLYVAAKIRKLSEEDGLDIVAEYDSFKSWMKKQRIETQQLDNTIEEELQERIVKKKSEVSK